MKKLIFIPIILIIVIYLFITNIKGKNISIFIKELEIGKEFYIISANITNNTNQDIIIRELISPLENSIRLVNFNSPSTSFSTYPHSNAPLSSWKLLRNATADMRLCYQGRLCKGDNFLVLRLACNEEVIESNVKKVFMKTQYETQESDRNVTSFSGVIDPENPERGLIERIFDHTPHPNSKFYVIGDECQPSNKDDSIIEYTVEH